MGLWPITFWLYSAFTAKPQGCERLMSGLTSDVVAQTEFLNQILVTFRVFVVEVSQVAQTLAHQLKQPATGVFVVLVDLQMLRQLVDARRQHGNLDFRRASVAFVTGI